MIRRPSSLPLAVLLVASLAGCGAPAATEGATPAPPGPVGSGLAPAGPEPWSLPACEGARLTFQQERSAASEGLPEGHHAYGLLLTASLEMHVHRCDALILGNRSVVAPFAWAVVYHLLNDTSGSADLDTFWREVLVSDAAVADELSRFGFPASLASIELGADAESRVLRIAGDGLRYEARWPSSAEDRASDESWTEVGHGLQGDRLVWAQVGRHEVYTSSVSLPMVLTAEGGYLGPALAGGQAGVVGTTAGSVAVRFGEGDVPGAGA
jgi:hypothetical protein